MSPVSSLQNLCIRAAIANVHYLSDVGDLDERLLHRILPHCKEKELRRIARETKGRDLTSVLDPCWKILFSRRFGVPSTEEMVAKMQRHKTTYSWREVYEAKEAALQQKLEEGGRRLSELSRQAEADNPKRQVQVLSAAASAVAERSLGKRKRGAAGAVPVSSLSRIQKARVQSTQSPLALIRSGIAKRAGPGPSRGALRPTPASSRTPTAPARPPASGRPAFNSGTSRTGAPVSATGTSKTPSTLHASPSSRGPRPTGSSQPERLPASAKQRGEAIPSYRR